MTPSFSEDHEDYLREFLNISMGKAASKLACVLDDPVTLTVPEVTLASYTEFSRILDETNRFHYTQQSFFGEMSGEVLTLLQKDGAEILTRDMWKLFDEQNTDNALVQETLLEISNILSGASLKGLCEQLNLKTKIQSPTMFFPDRTNIPENKWENSLLLKVSFFIDSAKFESRTVVCFANNGLVQLLNILDEFLEE